MSLKTSAASLYILHSGSSEVPSLCAKRIVAILPVLSWSTERRSAAVGEADASPTPTPARLISQVRLSFLGKKEIPSRTALEDSRPAIELENACKESWEMHWREDEGAVLCRWSYVDLIPNCCESVQKSQIMV